MYFSKFPSRHRSRARAAATRPRRVPGRVPASADRAVGTADPAGCHGRLRSRHLPPVAGERRALTPAVGSRPASALTPAASSPPASALTPSQIQTAYGINAISLGGVAGTGSGQTIAIVDAYDDPDIVSDAATFNTQFGLQQFNVAGGPTLTVLNQTGGTTPPAASGTYGMGGRGIARRPNRAHHRPRGQHHPLRGQQRLQIPTCIPRSRRPRPIPASPWFR